MTTWTPQHRALAALGASLLAGCLFLAEGGPPEAASGGPTPIGAAPPGTRYFLMDPGYTFTMPGMVVDVLCREEGEPGCPAHTWLVCERLRVVGHHQKGKDRFPLTVLLAPEDDFHRLRDAECLGDLILSPRGADDPLPAD